MRVLDEGVTRVGLSIISERLKREKVSVHNLLALDKSILKSPIKIISLDSSQTESIIQTNLSTQFAGSDGLRYEKAYKDGRRFLHFHFEPHAFYTVFFVPRKAFKRNMLIDIYNEARFFPI